VAAPVVVQPLVVRPALRRPPQERVSVLGAAAAGGVSIGGVVAALGGVGAIAGAYSYLFGKSLEQARDPNFQRRFWDPSEGTVFAPSGPKQEATPSLGEHGRAGLPDAGMLGARGAEILGDKVDTGAEKQVAATNSANRRSGRSRLYWRACPARSGPQFAAASVPSPAPS
jgi:hypothetical protein